MAHGTPTTTSPRPELAVYYFNSPTALPNQKKPIPLARPTSLVIVDNESNLNSEKGNKQQKSPRKMRSSLFHAFSSTSSPVTVAVAAPASSPKADGVTGLRDGDIASITSPVNDNANSAGNSISQPESADTFRVVSRPVRQHVAQSATAPDTTASARSVQVECTSPTTSSSAPSPSSSPSSKSPFKKRRRVVKTTRQSSPLRNPPILPSDLPSRPPSPPPTPAPKKPKAVSKRKPTVWEKRPLVQKVLLKEFERTPHGAEILRRGAKPGIAFLEEQKSQNSTTTKSGRKSGSDEENAVVVVSKPRSKDVSAMRHWGRIVKTALAGPLKEMAGPMAGDGRPPMPMIRAW